jgi:hypothetical protein
MKQCSRCKETKEYTQFTKNGTASDGHYSMCKDCKRDSQNRAKYGIDEEDYLRLLEEQENSCAICGVHHSLGQHGRLSIDHCHTTGEVRGLLCHKCNFGIGQFNDDIALLIKAIRYLDDGA